ncbi:MAG: GGDEF domain-containing protein [Proteobacteria bacterium]|nr:GGDEF domain-containing protein [Pseudomonadota bacterium]
MFKERSRRFQELSVTDGLTGLYNKRYIMSKLDSEVRHARGLDRALALLILDVDNFKHYNDTHGHPEGDEVLKRLAEVIRICVRETDSPCRYGGEEFLVILPETEAREAWTVAERIRCEMAGQTFRPGERAEVSVTLSIGLARLEPDEEAADLIRRADEALYRAKRDGKNRTVAAESRETA